MQPPALEDVQRAIGDRYQLLSAVGAGGMGFVYSARHVTLGHVVAVKVLPPEVAASEMRLRRFQQEAALAASLAHPHIVPVYDFGVREGITFSDIINHYYPDLQTDDIRACVQYAIDAVSLEDIHVSTSAS